MRATFHSSPCFSVQRSPVSSLPSSSEDQSISLASKNPNKNSLLYKHPLWQPTHANISLQFKEKILCLEIMGVDSGKALSQNPSLRTASLHSIHEIVTFLESKGIHQKDLGKIFGTCPNVLTSNIKTELNPVFNFLSYDLRIPEENFRKVINKCPRLLISSVRDQLKPALFYLQRIGFKDLHTLGHQYPVLLVLSVEKILIPKLQFLQNMGFSKTDAVAMVLKCPDLFCFSIENNYKPKFEYFVKEMNGRLEEIQEFPNYFGFSLDKKIKPRHVEAMEKAVKLSLPLMLNTTDEEFADLLRKQGRA